MLRTSAVPPGPGPAGLPAAPEEARLADILRLPPGRLREQEILHLVAGLSASLAALHEAGRAHGGICPSAVIRDAQGVAVLAPPADVAPDEDDAVRHAGYAAFEQYTDDPSHACGPWTDVYGLSALAYFLASGAAPPGALARRVRDDCPPLDEWQPGTYRAAFCAAVDEGLAMEEQARPRTAAALVAAMGAIPPAVAAAVAHPAPAPAADPEPEPDIFAPSLMAETPADESADPPPVAARLTAMRPERSARPGRLLPLAVAGLLLLAAVGYAWLRPAQPPQPATVATAPAPTPQTLPDSSAATGPASAPQTAAAGSVAPAASSKPESAPEPEAAAAPPVSEPAAPATPPPQAAPVTVQVAVRPWGEVLVNGRSRGVSPPLRELALPPGRYQVTVRNASAGDHRMTLTVAPGRPASITHEFK
ncbi:response regulator 21 [Achromobacter xylosoxidans A8]|uniref:Response regulator 21 n=1 Tax=Achromobacter xylosoxidans (strain A8) TaxID=762376 RepID=E3HRQ5_ACHXA|nr:serine/threonine-protein kinase [Achromobacter xylosoxidans]ADP19674.1 response regulator 21 [Achromobacter xylosoxidans A8]